MSHAIAGTQIHFNTCTKQSLVQPRTRTATQFGSKIKKPIFLTETRPPPGVGRAAATSWAAPAMMGSFYETLGISEKGTFLEIKKAYKQLARKYHPDVSPDPGHVDEYTTRFIQIQEAYETLSDPRTRALYDRDMGLHLALGFGARKRASNCSGLGLGLGLDERELWKNRWESQLDGLVRKSMSKRNKAST